jgi:hypothetical protein
MKPSPPSEMQVQRNTVNGPPVHPFDTHSPSMQHLLGSPLQIWQEPPMQLSQFTLKHLSMQVPAKHISQFAELQLLTQLPVGEHVSQPAALQFQSQTQFG